MGIFDFIKNAGKNLESNEKPKENLDIIQNKKRLDYRLHPKV